MDNKDLDSMKVAQDRILEHFKDLSTELSDYFHNYGEHNGMDFKYDFVRLQDRMEGLKDVFKKLFRRCYDRAEYKVKNDVSVDDSIKSRFEK